MNFTLLRVYVSQLTVFNSMKILLVKFVNNIIYLLMDNVSLHLVYKLLMEVVLSVLPIIY